MRQTTLIAAALLATSAFARPWGGAQWGQGPPPDMQDGNPSDAPSSFPSGPADMPMPDSGNGGWSGPPGDGNGSGKNTTCPDENPGSGPPGSNSTPWPVGPGKGRPPPDSTWTQPSPPDQSPDASTDQTPPQTPPQNGDGNPHHGHHHQDDGNGDNTPGQGQPQSSPQSPPQNPPQNPNPDPSPSPSAPSPAPSPDQSQSSPAPKSQNDGNSGSSSGSGSGSGGSTAGLSTYAATVVAHHNVHRANHSAPDIAWDDGLASTAAKIAASCNFAHNTEIDGGGYGQNIAAGSSPDDIASVISDEFYNGEVINFHSYGQDNPSDGFEGWGHFSQVVWKASTQVGCYTQDCSAQGLGSVGGGVSPWFTVCNYKTPGNFGGQYADNIGQSLGKPTVTGKDKLGGY